ncbi:hyccin isoform X2 [Zootermopsis nevadensis]|uniref:Hyccin n=1 Tax=Zootermopsis nevadensis TaxID=136037 RepID=A0A067RHC1_ZOONE|nr:hyccin isoform X2 [Zootermopsis nevadensis]KDR23157.1 Hyccin [Zootermopsis nevadensis]
MTEHVVHEWLADYSALSPVEVHSFASSLEHDQEVVAALYTVLEERSKYQELIDPVCNQLFGFYRSREIELQRFTLQFLPTLIFVYLNSVAHGDKKSCRSVETLLVGLYNLEVVDEIGQPKVVSFRLPSLAQASIYHEPMSLAPCSLTESALRRLEECNTKLVSWGPLPQVEALNAQNRLKVMTALLFVYNHQLSLLHKSALEHVCKVSSKLVTQGFHKPGHHQRSSYGSSDLSFVPRLLPRIPVSSQFLLELLHAVYFAMFNDFSYIATQALEDIYGRACHEGYAQVVLVTSAIRNSLHVNPSGQPGDGPMGISVALSPATTTVTTVSKSMITNASFRTKKLPDDIPIQVAKDESGVTGGEGKNLTSISEEQEEERMTPRGSSLRGGKNLPKLPNFPGLGKKAKAAAGGGDVGGKKAQPGMKPVACNGDSEPEKKPAATISAENTNGPLSLDGNGTANGSISSEQDRAISELSELSGPSDTQSLVTADSIDLDDATTLLTVRKKPSLELENRAALQVSSV